MKQLLKKLFKWLLLLSAALAVGIAVLLYNPGLVKGPLERYLSDMAGYPISIEGELEIDTGRMIELSAADIRITGSDWTDGRALVAVGRLRLALVTSSLFEDIVVLESLQVDNLQLDLETDANGTGNWLSANTPTANNDGGGNDPVVIFRNIEVSDTTIRYQDGKSGDEHVLHIALLDQHQQADGMLQITLDADFNDRPVEFSGTVGPFVNLLAGHDVAFTGDGHFGTLNITGSGLVDDLLEPRRPQFTLLMEGPDIDEITAMLGLDDLGSGGFSLRAKADEFDGFYEAGINGKIGDISLDISAVMSDLSQLDELDLHLALNGPSLGSFTRALGVENWPDKPFRLKGDIKRVGGMLNVPNLTLSIGGTELVLDALLSNFPSLDASRIKLSITGDDVAQFRRLLGVPGIATGPFEVHGRLDVSLDEVELLELEIKTALGQVNLSGTLGASPDYTGSKLHLHVDGHNANTLMSAFSIDALPEESFSLDARIETVKNGLMIERGVLVTIGDERLELGGFIALNSGAYGTDIEARVAGQHLAQMLQRLIGDTTVPDLPYDLSGRIRVVDKGIELKKIKAVYAGVELALAGLISLDDQLLGTALDFQLSGDNLSSLSIFPVTGDSLGIFVPGQSYQAAGRFTVEDNGWQLSDISGRLGETAFDIQGLISTQPEWAGSNVRFSVGGPDLHGLLANQEESALPTGAFETSGQITLSDDSLSINELSFETVKAHGKVDLELGWPVSDSIDAGFDINLWGDDIRHLLPPLDAFEPELAAYNIKLAGQKRGDLISLKHLNANIGSLQVSLKGAMNDDPTDENVDISFSIESNDLSTLGRLYGEPLPAMALDLKADFNGNTRQFVFHDLTATLGESHIDAMLDVSLDGPKPIIKLTAKSDYIDIRPFMALTDSDSDAEETTTRERLIPATPLPFESLAAADITISIDIVEMQHRKGSFRNLDLKARVQAGSLTVEKLSFDGPRGKIRSALSITPTDANTADVEIDLTAEKMVLNLTGQAADKLHQVPAIDIIIRASGKGGNLQQVAGSVNGSIYIGTEGGTLEGVNLSILDTFILDEIFNLIMPKGETNDDLELTCAATVLKITDGLVETDPALAFTTSQIKIVSKGTLDLKTEKINFNFNATPNNALKISAGELFNPYILVGGTLAKPEVGLDPAKVLLHGSVAIGTAGVSILAKGLLDRVGNTVPLCEEMLSQAQQQ
jgi:uncharacterized protein involved in outer membrane biogenesis